MSNEPIEEAYFNWLCAKVLSRDVPIYLDLMRILHNTEFVWLIIGDDNRASDGIDLRYDFLSETKFVEDKYWMDIPASVLEVIIAFSKRASFQTDIPVKDWFWSFMQNLELDEYRQVSGQDRDDIEDILNNFVWRQYDGNGYGGMFPLRWPKRNQREVEIWYQFCEYLEEQDLG